MMSPTRTGSRPAETVQSNGFAQFFTEEIRVITDVIKTPLGELSVDDPSQSDGQHTGLMFMEM
jgi:hypothetical protein